MSPIGFTQAPATAHAPQAAMTDVPYVPSGRFVKAAPGRTSLVVCWAVDAVVAGAIFVGTLLITLALLSAFGVHTGGVNPLGGHMDTWAAFPGVALATAAAAPAAACGRDGRSPGHQLAELKIDDMSGRPAPAWRRMLRVAVLLLAVGLLAPVHWVLAALVAVGLIGTELIASERRGLLERLTGLRDYESVLERRLPGPAHPGSSVP